MRHGAVAGLDPLDGCEQLGAERHVVLGRLGDVLVAQGGDRVLDQRLVGLRLGFARPRSGEAGRPRRARRRGRAGCAATLREARRARCRTRRSTPRPCTPSGPGRSTSKSPAQRTPPRWASMRLHLDLAPVARLRRLVADDRAEDVVPVAEDVGLDGDRVADDPLGRVPAAVDRRRRVLDDDPLRRAVWYAPARRCLAGVGSTWVLTRVGFPEARVAGWLGTGGRGPHARKISFLAMGKPLRVIRPAGRA